MAYHKEVEFVLVHKEEKKKLSASDVPCREATEQPIKWGEKGYELTKLVTFKARSSDHERNLNALEPYPGSQGSTEEVLLTGNILQSHICSYTEHFLNSQQTESNKKLKRKSFDRDINGNFEKRANIAFNSFFFIKRLLDLWINVIRRC